MAEKYFKYLPAENRYVLEERIEGGQSLNPPQTHRVFEQAAVLHTSEDQSISLTRAYNLEDDIAVNDGQLRLGATQRGQVLGDISGGNHLVDEKPEEGF